MSLRVIAGSARGRRLKPVPGDGTRAIMDRVKEALFSIIGREIIDTRVLDLFAGTGSVGIEALSRGAAHATFIDLERAAIKIIHENLAITQLAERAAVRRADSLRLIAGQAPAAPYDFIYVAPPQYKSLWQNTLKALEANPAWVPPGVRVIVQIDPKEYTDLPLKHLVEYDRRSYGRTLLWFLESLDPADRPTDNTKNNEHDT